MTLTIVPSAGATTVVCSRFQRAFASCARVASACASITRITNVTAQTPAYGWGFSSEPEGWTLQRTGPEKFAGPGVRGSVQDLLDTSAGRTNLAQLLLSRRLVVQDLRGFMRLAPLLHEVPGLPGGPVLKTAVGGLGRVTRLLRLT